MPRLLVRGFLVASLLAASAPAARAVVIEGAGGQGVPVGQSSLIGQLDYSDTFTGVDTPDNSVPRRFIAQQRPEAAYNVESAYGNPDTAFRQRFGNPPGPELLPNFSFAGGSTPGSGGLVQGNAQSIFPGSSGAGSDTGFTQTGGGVDYGIVYGLRDEYIVQVDAVQVPDRIDITSAPTRGSIFQPGSLTVFFRGQPETDPIHGNGISLFNGTTDTAIRTQPGYENFNTGLAGSRQWHNYAVRFDQADNEIEIFVDEESLGVIDLTTFADGIYANFSNGAVGAGGSPGGGNRVWTDNFQVGAPIPEPGALAVASLGLLALAARRRR